MVVRAALMPLTLKQFKSMQNMARFQPEIKKLQEKYKGDRERLNQEMMKFYRENKVNPFASCLPLVAQLPVFLVAVLHAAQGPAPRHLPGRQPAGHRRTRCPAAPAARRSFLFIPDLTDKATGGVLVALIVLYVGSQLLSTILMSTATDRTQRIIFLALPFVFVIFVINFPAGLLVYWITTNLWTIVQQTIVRKRLGPMRPPSAGRRSRRRCRSWTGCSTGDRRRRPAPRRPAPRRRTAVARAAASGQRQRRAATSRSRGQGAQAARATAVLAAEEEEAIREAAMSEHDRTPADRVRELLEQVNDALGLDAEVEVIERGRPDPRRPRTARTWASSSAATGRRSTPSSTSRSRSPRTASSPAPKVEVDAAGLPRPPPPGARAPGRPGRRRRGPLGRPVALDAMSATERKVVHEYLKDRDDVETYSEGTEPDRHLVVAPLGATDRSSRARGSAVRDRSRRRTRIVAAASRRRDTGALAAAADRFT